MRKRLPPELIRAFVRALDGGEAVAAAIDGIAVAAAVLADPLARWSLADRSVPLAIRDERLRKVFAKRVPDVVLGFLLALQQRDRLQDFAEAKEYLLDEVEHQSGHRDAEVRSAVAIPASALATLERRLRERLGVSSVRLTVTVDPAVLAGIRVSGRGWEIDHSFDGFIQRFLRASYA
jgi:F0F1-type ATP synthase delta subunit